MRDHRGIQTTRAQSSLSTVVALKVRKDNQTSSYLIRQPRRIKSLQKTQFCLTSTRLPSNVSRCRPQPSFRLKNFCNTYQKFVIQDDSEKRHSNRGTTSQRKAILQIQVKRLGALVELKRKSHTYQCFHPVESVRVRLVKSLLSDIKCPPNQFNN